MERQFCINWPAIVEEAKQRRKKQKLTQQKLAVFANVSTPTLSRFENGEKDLQLSSIINILKTLGMIDQRQLIFPEPKARKNFDLDCISFIGQDDKKTVQCAISYEALLDYFSKEKKDPLKIFIANRESIEHEARRKYLASKLEPDGSVFVKTEDF